MAPNFRRSKTPYRRHVGLDQEMVAELILHEGRLDLRAFEIADRKHIVLSIVRFCDLIGID